MEDLIESFGKLTAVQERYLKF